MDFDCNDLNFRTIKADKVTLGPEWRTGNFFPNEELCSGLIMCGVSNRRIATSP